MFVYPILGTPIPLIVFRNQEQMYDKKLENGNKMWDFFEGENNDLPRFDFAQRP